MHRLDWQYYSKVAIPTLSVCSTTNSCCQRRTLNMYVIFAVLVALCLSVCLPACLPACLYVCMYVCMYICTHISSVICVVSRLTVVSREAKKKQHACASSGPRDHYSELFTRMAALKF